MVNRLQLHGGDAEPREVVDGRRSGEARVGAPELRRHGGVALREALDVSLVDDRVGVGDCRRGVGGPIEVARHHQTAWHVGGRVQLAHGFGVAEHVARHSIAPGHVAVDGQRVGVQEQLVGVAPKAAPRLVRPKDAIAVALAGTHSWGEAVPDAVLLPGAAAGPRRRLRRRGTAKRHRRHPRRRRNRYRRRWAWRPGGMAGPAIARSSDVLPRR